MGPLLQVDEHILSKHKSRVMKTNAPNCTSHTSHETSIGDVRLLDLLKEAHIISTGHAALVVEFGQDALRLELDEVQHVLVVDKLNLRVVDLQLYDT